MNEPCVDEPISFLRLERHLLDELEGSEQAEVVRHLDACPACRACFEQLRMSELALGPLPAPSPRPAHTPVRSLRQRLGRPLAVVSALAAAALVGLALRSATQPPAAPPAHRFVKGGELALVLVRERGGVVSRDPEVFQPDDRFAALLTCPPGRVHWELAVFQDGETFFPLRSDALLACGNQVSLEGAFRLTGDQPALVCAVIDARTEVSRTQLTSPRALPETSACVELRPAER